MDFIRRICVAGAVAAVGSLALGAGQAGAASSVEIIFLGPTGVVEISGDGGVNRVTVGVDQVVPDHFRITDLSGILDPIPPGCVRLDQSSIRCPILNNIDRVEVRLEGGDDHFASVPGALPEDILLIVHGGKGADTIRGRDGPGTDLLIGDEGHDRLFGEGGNDKLFGGIGADELDGGTGDDDLFGDAGDDNLNGGEGFFEDRLDGGSGNDILNGLKEDDKLFGGKGNDKLLGGPGDDKGIGGPGRDLFAGGKGRDRGKAEREKGVEV
jgi:Ca2+-binding RTX toxin-like protein